MKIFAMSLGFLFVMTVSSFASEQCFPKKILNSIIKINGLKEKGTMSVDGGDMRGPLKIEVAYVNTKQKFFLSVKKTGECLGNPVFLTEDEYESHFVFEGDTEE